MKRDKETHTHIEWNVEMKMEVGRTYNMHTHTPHSRRHNLRMRELWNEFLPCSFSHIVPNAIHRLQTSIDTNGFNSDNTQCTQAQNKKKTRDAPKNLTRTNEKVNKKRKYGKKKKKKKKNRTMCMPATWFLTHKMMPNRRFMESAIYSVKCLR